MSRSALILDLAIVFCLGLLLLILSNLGVSPIPASVKSTSSTLAIVPGFSLPNLTFPSLRLVPDSEGTIREQKAVPAASTGAPLPARVSAAPAPVVEPAPLEDAAVLLRRALVNIICIAPTDSGLRSISGSGVLIDPKGVVLTNAHVAQYFLLPSYDISCTVRSGTPAAVSYAAVPIYISLSWLEEHAGSLTKKNPVGTGEHDFALLAITESTSPAPLPSAFPAISLAAEPPAIGDGIAIATYGAQSLGYERIQNALYPTVVFGSVKDVFTFDIRSVDIIALGGSAAAQQGSSGGGVADENGELVGIITTSSITGDISTRSLNAITASYIRRDYAEETGGTLDALLAAPSAAAATFAPQIPSLEALITAQL